MFHFVYKITNLKTGKYYIGKHSTKDRNDNYLGSSEELFNDVEKYGYSNFEREIIYEATTSEDALEYEAKLVNQDFVNDPRTYNKKVGGFGGWNRQTYQNYNKKNRENNFNRSIFNDKKWNW